MLVLSRKTNERILIDECIEVTILEVRGQRVKLGFRAPRDVRVSRPETVRRPLAPRVLVFH